jgi:hypothetical protein
MTQYNLALVLTKMGRLPDAWDYASAALRNIETLGTGAAAEIEQV